MFEFVNFVLKAFVILLSHSLEEEQFHLFILNCVFRFVLCAFKLFG
jgi:hypothetical protein